MMKLVSIALVSVLLVGSYQEASKKGSIPMIAGNTPINQQHANSGNNEQSWRQTLKPTKCPSAQDTTSTPTTTTTPKTTSCRQTLKPTKCPSAQDTTSTPTTTTTPKTTSCRQTLKPTKCPSAQDTTSTPTTTTTPKTTSCRQTLKPTKCPSAQDTTSTPTTTTTPKTTSCRQTLKPTKCPSAQDTTSTPTKTTEINLQIDGYSSDSGCWTDWFDRDDPCGTGDFESLSVLKYENPGKICDNPLQIEVQTTAGLGVADTGDVIFVADTTSGFMCKNSEQTNGTCQDYRVRFMCPSNFCSQEVCWTTWFNRDNPGGSGDRELLRNLRKDHPGAICESPLYIDVFTRDTNKTAISTGQAFYIYSPDKGFVCRNRDQKRRRCRDYKVRFGCPCPCNVIES